MMWQYPHVILPRSIINQFKYILELLQLPHYKKIVFLNVFEIESISFRFLLNSNIGRYRNLLFKKTLGVNPYQLHSSLNTWNGIEIQKTMCEFFLFVSTQTGKVQYRTAIKQFMRTDRTWRNFSIFMKKVFLLLHLWKMRISYILLYGNLPRYGFIFTALHATIINIKLNTSNKIKLDHISHGCVTNDT